MSVRARPSSTRRQGQDVGQKEVPCVDDGKRQQRPAEAGARPSKVARQREYGPERDGQGRQFDQRIKGADPCAAVAAAAARNQPAKESSVKNLQVTER